MTTEEGELWAKEEELLFVEASAKSGVNVEFAFEEATRDILRKIHTGVFDDERVRVLAPLSPTLRMNAAKLTISLRSVS